MRVKLQIAHQVPGRIRMKIPSAKGDPALLEEIQKTFSTIPRRATLVMYSDGAPN